jgi:hypothetical protein
MLQMGEGQRYSSTLKKWMLVELAWRLHGMSVEVLELSSEVSSIVEGNK